MLRVLAIKVLENRVVFVTDPELVICAVAGDPRAFTELYVRYVKRITSLAGRMLHHGSECDEVIQEIFLQVHLSLPRFEARSSFYTWIYRLAKNVVLHHIRGAGRRHRVAQLDDVLAARLVRPAWLTGANPEQDAVYNALLAETTRVIAQLAPKLREVMVLGPVEGGTCQELASELGVTTEIVKSRLHRARTSVKDAMWRVERRGAPLIAVLAPPVIAIPIPPLAVR